MLHPWPSAPYQGYILILAFSSRLFFLFDNANSTALFMRLSNSGFPLVSHPLLSLMAALLAPPGRVPSVSPNYLFIFLMKTSNFGGVMCFINLITETNDEIWANGLKYIWKDWGAANTARKWRRYDPWEKGSSSDLLPSLHLRLFLLFSMSWSGNHPLILLVNRGHEFPEQMDSLKSLDDSSATHARSEIPGYTQRNIAAGRRPCWAEITAAERCREMEFKSCQSRGALVTIWDFS